MIIPRGAQDHGFEGRPIDARRIPDGGLGEYAVRLQRDQNAPLAFGQIGMLGARRDRHSIGQTKETRRDFQFYFPRTEIFLFPRSFSNC